MKLTKQQSDRQYKFEVSVKIVERSVLSNDKLPELQFAIAEKIPCGVHPVDYLRQRLSEEIRRHASQASLDTKAPITTSGEIAA
ncbi:hypothetical protein OJF2_51310 [Aquisphaera giovannonii]|uniref:Uncharacterized protein n=1 Tax=Aquisphaera giovannonii TaxID=406548 RepID=A0A5B9W864_9BACT|nr:hypothetical protein [Aquisphaera giovannonii]QEH36547.1 hypothetical protein OJF2_51310 [Aquisphaera giovannonii]